MQEVLSARAAVKRSQGRPRAGYRAAKRVFLATGAVWQGVVLIAFGALIIGLVDNFLRPILVGKDTKMPDYVVLISTLGGLATFGLNGFVIGPVIAAMFIAAWDIFSVTAVRLRLGMLCNSLIFRDVNLKFAFKSTPKKIEPNSLF